MPVMACVPLNVTFKIDYLQTYRTCKQCVSLVLSVLDELDYMQPPPTLWHADSMYPNPGYRYTGNLKRGDSAQLVRQMCTNYPCIWSIACSSMSLLPVGTTGDVALLQV